MLATVKRSQSANTQRRGTVIALMAVTIVVLIGFLGLAIDLGMVALAKTQAQNAADLAALTAARTLSGDSGATYNQSAATTNAQNLLTYNSIVGQRIKTSQLSLSYGTYDYSQTDQSFSAHFPGTTGQPTTAVTSTVTFDSIPGAFSKVFGSDVLPTVTATATAVHRPRDVALIMDLSGSMRFGTCTGYDFYTATRSSNNADDTIPSFGHYSATASAGLQAANSNRTSGFDNYNISPSNITAATTSYSLTYVNNFYANAAYASTLIRAFDSYTSSDGGKTWSAPAAGTTPAIPASTYKTTPGGDVPLKVNASSSYAKTVNEVIGGSGSPGTRNAAWELDGYSNYVAGSNTSAASGLSSYPTSGSGAFYGYTRGPGYYGKTFFSWPPDPRRPLTTASNTTQLNQFLQDFGYVSGTDLANAAYSGTTNAKITTTSGTTITVAAATASLFPTTNNFKIQVNGAEIMLVTAGANTTTWTVTRAQDGTAAATTSSVSVPIKLLTTPPLLGIYTAANTSVTPGKTPSTAHAWPWPSDSGSSLSTYLKAYVFAPVSVASSRARLLATTDAAYQKIMRLYNWNYAVDTVGATPCDWRLRFFGTNDNTRIFSSTTGSLNLPGAATYTINYNEILRWIAQSDNPFPSQLRAGRVKYYSQIPTSITGSYPSYGGTDQRFWVEFIDYVLGFTQISAGVYQDITAMTGYGGDFLWTSATRNAVPSATQYMNYSDNPARPKLRMWFGPLMMADFLQNYNLQVNVPKYFFMQPGDSYEAPLYTAKVAFLAAVDTMQTNHPNDWFTTICFSHPRSSASDLQRFNNASAPLGTNYAYAKAALCFPFSTINANGTCNNTEVTPYDSDPATSNIPSANFMDTPRGDGETCFAMGLMLAYNQFAVTKTSDATLRSFVTSSPITFPSGLGGGLGRKGAQKVIIFETDGLPNTLATATLQPATGYSYYKIRYDMNKPGSSEYPTVTVLTNNDTTVTNQINSLVDQLKNDYGSTRNPFRLYAIGFGPVFSGADAADAKSTLQTMQFHAGTQSSASTALPSNQIITGTDSQMSANMISAYTSILQKGVQIALIK